AGCGAAGKLVAIHDFVDAALGLAAADVCARDRIAAMGESSGGLIVTAAMNERPDLFRVVLALYPFVDCVDTMLDTSLPGTTDEFDEWGNPALPADYAAMMRWSPYDNVAAVAYPAIFLRGAMHDDEVMVWEPAKLAAKLRAVGTGSRPLVLETYFARGIGHLGPADTAGHLRDRAAEFAFALRELGVR
ncbi:MAG: prolyl oligopeptidase family serine peptidase, partial [Polyangiaceae bacterium]